MYTLEHFAYPKSRNSNPLTYRTRFNSLTILSSKCILISKTVIFCIQSTDSMMCPIQSDSFADEDGKKPPQDKILQ